MKSSVQDEEVIFSGYRGSAIYRWDIPKGKLNLESKVINAVRLYFALERYDLISRKVIACWHKFFNLEAVRPYATALSVAYPEVRECIAGVERLNKMLPKQPSKPFLAQFVDALSGVYRFSDRAFRLEKAVVKFEEFVKRLEGTKIEK